jgi:hypothetical protein
MQKKYLTVLSFVVIFAFSYCSSDKDSFSEKPTIDISKPLVYPEEDFTLFLKNHVPNSDLYVEGGILQNQENNAKFSIPARKWQGVPSIGMDKFGNLFVAWLAGTCPGECDDNYLTVSVSSDKGRSWNNDKLILDVKPDDSTRMKEANFFNDKLGNLYMYWGKHVQKKSVAAKEWAITWYSKIRLSDDDNTINYTPPRRIAEGILLNKLFYSSISDQVVFPIARWYGGNPELHQPFIYKANYGTKSLVNFTKVGAIPLPVSIRFIYEHMVVQLKDSTYVGMVRTLDGLYYSKSKDGNNWDYGKKFDNLGPTTPSRFHLAKLKSGRLLLIFNNSKSRSNMTICLSDDDGATWPHRMVLDARDGVSYPDMIETEPGKLNIVYDYIRTPIGTINFVVVQEDDIVNNITSNIFRTKIHTLK